MKYYAMNFINLSIGKSPQSNFENRSKYEYCTWREIFSSKYNERITNEKWTDVVK